LIPYINVNECLFLNWFKFLFKLKNVLVNCKIEASRTDKIALICFYLECGLNHYQIYNWTLGGNCFDKALEHSNLDFKLDGVFGKRTKFQQNDIAQLILKIIKLNGNTDFQSLKHSNENLKPNMLTKSIELNDESVLDKIKYKNQKETQNTELTQLEQTVLYCIFYNTKKNSPNDELTKEELKAFIDVSCFVL
jgi:hypothetical protein